MVRNIIDVAVGTTRPELTLLLLVSLETSEQRRLARQSTMPFMRDRMEEADRGFFERVAHGYNEIAATEPQRVKAIFADRTIEELHETIWRHVQSLLRKER